MTTVTYFSYPRRQYKKVNNNKCTARRRKKKKKLNNIVAGIRRSAAAAAEDDDGGGAGRAGPGRGGDASARARAREPPLSSCTRRIGTRTIVRCVGRVADTDRHAIPPPLYVSHTVYII